MPPVNPTPVIITDQPTSLDELSRRVPAQPMYLVDPATGGAQGLDNWAIQSPAITAKQILRHAANPLGDLTQVMAGVTITDPVSDGANSTVQAAKAVGVGNGTYNAENPLHCTLLGAETIVSGRAQTITRQAGSVIGGHGWGVAFWTDAQVFDVCIRVNNAPMRWIAYVTDVDGRRRRISSTDRAQAFANYNYYKIDLGSAGVRLIEVYAGSVSNIAGINVPNGFTVWPADHLKNEPRFAACGDSFFEGSMNNIAQNLKLSMTDWIGAFMGIRNPIVNGIGSTGVIANAGASNFNNFQQRLAAGDFSIARIGKCDLILLSGSVNDNTPTNGGLAITTPNNATVQAAFQSFVAGVMAAQPQAIIMGIPQEFTNTTAADATRVAAYKAGFNAAGAGSSRVIWLDRTLYESATPAGYIGTDLVHPADISGARLIGQSLARSICTALRNLAGQ